MNISKYFGKVFIITLLGLLYTHQQFLITKTSYDIVSRQSRVSQLLDHNLKLVYNISALESPYLLESKLATCDVKYEVPRRWVVVKEKKKEDVYELARASKRRNLTLERILSFFASRAEAHEFKNSKN